MFIRHLLFRLIARCKIDQILKCVNSREWEIKNTFASRTIHRRKIGWRSHEYGVIQVSNVS